MRRIGKIIAAYTRSGGFTLIELMIVVAIVAILAAIALPSYSRYVIRTRRSDGQQFLAALAAAEERYYTNFNKYTTSITGTGVNGLNFASANSDKGYYTVAIANGSSGDTQSYTMTATPVAPQDADTWCGSLILQSSGAKSANPGNTTNGACWQ